MTIRELEERLERLDMDVQSATERLRTARATLDALHTERVDVQAQLIDALRAKEITK